MQVQPTADDSATQDLASMLEAHPQGDTSPESRVEEFEANLTNALINSGVTEEANLDDSRVADSSPITTEAAEAAEAKEAAEEDSARQFEQQASNSTPSESLRSTLAGLAQPTSPASGTAASGDASRPQRSVHRQTRPSNGQIHPAEVDRNSTPLTPAMARPILIDQQLGDRADIRRAVVTATPETTSIPEAGQSLDRLRTEHAPTTQTSDPSQRVTPVTAEVAALAKLESQPRGLTRPNELTPRTVERASGRRELPRDSIARTERVEGAQRREPTERQDSNSLQEPLPRYERVPQETTASSERVFTPATTILNQSGNLATAGIQVQDISLQRAPITTEFAPGTNSPQPVEALPQHVEMLASRGGGSVRLRLHPERLGDVDITISIRGDAVDVVIHAEEPAARSAVLAHRDQLAEALGSRELRMEGFDVSSGRRDQESGERQTPGSNSEQRSAESTARMGSRKDAEQEPVIEPNTTGLNESRNQQGIDVRI